MKSILTKACILLALIAVHAMAQPTQSADVKTVTGTVVDTNGNPIPNANVLVQIQAAKKTQIPLTTDANGNFTFTSDSSPSQFYYVQAVADGYSLGESPGSRY